MRPSAPLTAPSRDGTSEKSFEGAPAGGIWPKRPLPPKPEGRTGDVTLWRYLRLFRRDLLSAQPNRLFGAWMAEFRTPFFQSYLVNQPDLVDLVLRARPDDFPKSDRIREGLAPLLGASVFVTNGATWRRQRRIIEQAFDAKSLRSAVPTMAAAADAAVARLSQAADGRPVEIEESASHAAADVIFRTLFSVPITETTAAQVFDAFGRFQRAQPLINLAAFLPLPRWVPRGHRRRTRATARSLRRLMARLVDRRLADIAGGRAPLDLASTLLTVPDPETGLRFDREEMIDQVAIFFLAGHETSASSLAWALYLLARYPDVQLKVAEEADGLTRRPELADLSQLSFTRDVFREVLRLYPPVPMMVREATQPEQFRGRPIASGAQIVLSPWHLHRHCRLWETPDAFRPERWTTERGKASARSAYLPFSTGPRVCPGAGFAMAEGVLLLASLIRAYRFGIAPEASEPVPVAHLTVRSKDGLWLTLSPRQPSCAVA